MDFLRSRHAVWLTHGSALVMTCALFALILFVPFRYAFIPAALIAHRIGVMMHEYIHGIPFRRYANCLGVLVFYDGLMLMFGLLELFRATHLSHHRWLNSPGDSAFDNLDVKNDPNRLRGAFVSLEVTQHLKFYWEALHGLHPYASPKRIAFCVAQSCAWIALWVYTGRTDVIWKIAALTAFTTAVPVSLRGAVEHHAEADHAGFANEYKTLIPLFNLNKHVHHHEQPTLPWYLLEFRTAAPLHWRNYYTYWFRAYIRKELVLMHPMRHRRAQSS
ncbi:MAG TPA: fatty acid desaturase [Thermoanaerobaculia bacterium]|nr:fatty acid desaturase [Thermoanaerobaculia bacterium]